MILFQLFSVSYFSEILSSVSYRAFLIRPECVYAQNIPSGAANEEWLAPERFFTLALILKNLEQCTFSATYEKKFQNPPPPCRAIEIISKPVLINRKCAEFMHL